jgi:hypothetical protein
MTATAIAVQEKPILFSGAMVRKIIEDLKTNTRRVMKPQPFLERGKDGENWWLLDRSEDGYGKTNSAWKEGAAPFWTYCPYGKPGDRLYVRETHYRWGYWKRNGKTDKGIQRWKFIALDEQVLFAAETTRTRPNNRTSIGWWKRPGIFLPKKLARLTLEIVSVKVERVQEISHRDAKAEGISEGVFRELLKPGNRFNVVPEHWIHGDDESRSFCEPCCRKEIARLKKLDPKRELILDGGWDTEGDSQAFCETCGRALSNTFTDYCAEAELSHFEENGFDVSSPDDCYSAQRIIGSQLWDDGELSARIHKLAFRALWDSINAKRDGGKCAWAKNPWVWAISFRQAGA